MKNKTIKKYVLVVIISMLFSGLGLSKSGWKLTKNSNGIQVYTRPIKGSKFKEFKGVTVINAKIEVLAAILRDIPAYPKWFDDCIKACVVKRFDKNNLIIYFAQNAPWPVNDREVVFKATTNINYKKGIAKARLKSIAYNTLNVEKDFVRMKSMDGDFVMKYINRDKTRVIYRIKADPGGDLPATLVNLTSKALPYNTLKNMRKMSRKKKYKERAKNSYDGKMIQKNVDNGNLK